MLIDFELPINPYHLECSPLPESYYWSIPKESERQNMILANASRDTCRHAISANDLASLTFSARQVQFSPRLRTQFAEPICKGRLFILIAPTNPMRRLQMLKADVRMQVVHALLPGN
jgi:hypothetical protein